MLVILWIIVGTVLALGLVGGLMLVWASHRAPEGHEDREGFHRDSSIMSSDSGPSGHPATGLGAENAPRGTPVTR